MTTRAATTQVSPRLALPAAPNRLALHGTTSKALGCGELHRAEAAVNTPVMSAAQYYAETLGGRLASRRSAYIVRPYTERERRRPAAATRHGAHLKDLEAEMERSPHGKITHARAQETTGDDFLFGPPRPDRAEWERLTALWLTDVWHDISLHNTNRRDPGRGSP